jgi:hypothetical protein
VPEPARKAPVMVTRDEIKPTRLGEWTDGADGLSHQDSTRDHLTQKQSVGFV